MNQLIETFNLEKKPPISKSVQIAQKQNPPQVIENIIDQALYEDFQNSRRNCDSIMELGKTALEKALEFSEMAQESEWYDTVASLLKSINDTNRIYMENHEKISKIMRIKAEISSRDAKTGNIHIENAFIGTTKDLLDQVKPKIIDVTNE